jgi:hypothetical protein
MASENVSYAHASRSIPKNIKTYSQVAAACDKNHPKVTAPLKKSRESSPKNNHIDKKAIESLLYFVNGQVGNSPNGFAFNKDLSENIPDKGNDSNDSELNSLLQTILQIVISLISNINDKPSNVAYTTQNLNFLRQDTEKENQPLL